MQATETMDANKELQVQVEEETHYVVVEKSVANTFSTITARTRSNNSKTN
jgi:hypothetical protein